MRMQTLVEACGYDYLAVTESTARTVITLDDYIGKCQPSGENGLDNRQTNDDGHAG